MAVDIEETVTEDFGFRSISTGIKVAPALDTIPLKELNLLAWGNITKKFALSIENSLLIGDTAELDAYINLSKTEEEEKQVPVFTGGRRTDISGVSQLIFNATESTLLASIDKDLKTIEPSTSEITNVESFDSSIRRIYASPFYQSICAVLLEDHLVIMDISNASNRLKIPGVSSFSWSQMDKSTFYTINDKTIQKKTLNGAESNISQPNAIEDSFKPLQITSILNNDEELLFTVYGESIDEDEHDYKHYILGGTEQKILDVCPPYGSLPRKAIYYLSQLKSWSPNWPNLTIVASSPSTDIQAFTPEKLVSQLNDTDRAQLPLDEDSGEDDTPLGLAVDLTSEQEVLEPCNGIDTCKPLPRVWVLTNQGNLLSWALFDSHGIKSNSISNEHALQSFRSYYETAKQSSTVSLKEVKADDEQTASENPPQDNSELHISPSPMTQPNEENSSSNNEQPSTSINKNETSSFGSSGFGSSGFGSQGFGSSGFISHGFGSSGFGSSGFEKSAFGSSGFSSTQNNDGKDKPAFGNFNSNSNASNAFTKSTPAFGSTGFGSNASSSSPFAKLSQQRNKVPDAGFSSTSSPFSKFGSSNNSQTSPFASVAPNKKNESIFGGDKPKSSIFDTSAKPTSIFQKEDPSAKKSIFEQAANNVSQIETADTKPNVFGSSPFSKLNDKPSIFGESSSSSSIFDKPKSETKNNELGGSLFGNMTTNDNPFSKLNIGTKEPPSATEQESLDDAFSHKIAIHDDSQNFSEEEKNNKDIPLTKTNSHEEHDDVSGESEVDGPSENPDRDHSLPVSNSEQELANTLYNEAPTISSSEESNSPIDEQKLSRESSNSQNSFDGNEQPEFSPKDSDTVEVSTDGNGVSNGSSSSFVVESPIDESAQSDTVGSYKQSTEPHSSSAAVTPFNQAASADKSDNSEGDSSSFEMVKVEDAKENTNDYNTQAPESKELPHTNLQSNGTGTTDSPMKNVAVGSDLSTLQSSSGTQTDDELTQSQNSMPMNVPEYLVLGETIMPQQDSDPIVNQIERVCQEVESEFAILEMNSNNIGKFIEDHQNEELTHTELSLEYESFWRLNEASTIKGYVEELSGKLEKDLNEFKSLEEGTLEQLSALKSQFSDTNVVKEHIHSLDVFKAVSESPEFLKQPLDFKMTESRKNINTKLEGLDRKLREAWSDTLKLKLQFANIEGNIDSLDEVYKGFLSNGF